MKPREYILILIAAAFGGIAVVSWSGEASALSNLDVARKTHLESLRDNGAKLVAAERKAEEAVARMKSAQAAENAASAKAASSIDGSKQAISDLAKAKEDLAKAATKVAELEKARSEATSRINELNTEIANLRDGSEVKAAVAKQKKAEADLEAASVALREANVKAAAAITKQAEVEEENRRLRDQAKGSDNASPNYRAL
jgi:hypothetical protein